MAKRGLRPKDPVDTKGGVRGTHGLGDEPRKPPDAPEETAMDETLGNPAVDEEERVARGLATEPTHGPGPEDEEEGSARVRERRLRELRARGLTRE